MRLYSEDIAGKLRSAFEKIVLAWPGVTKKTMFGCPAYLVNGRLFSFLTSEGIVLTSLDKATKERLKRSVEWRPFKAGSRTVKHWSLIPLPDPVNLPSILSYIRTSYESASISGS